MSMTEVLPDVIIPANDPQVQSNEVTPTNELAAAKYMREIGYWSPSKYPNFQKRKEKNTKKKKSTRYPKKESKKDIPAITNMTAFREVSPVMDQH